MEKKKSVIILSTKTCIKCKSLIPVLSEELESLGISYIVLDALSSGRSLVNKLNIVSVPTVLIYDTLGSEPVVMTGNFTVEDVLKTVNIGDSSIGDV